MIQFEYKEKSRRQIMEYRARILTFDKDSDDYERVIAGEIARCKKSFWHWLTHWVYTKNEDYNPGENPSQIFPHKKYLKVIADAYQIHGEHLIILKSRQIMATWISLMYKLHQTLYFPGRNLLIQARKEDDVVDFFTRIEHTYHLLPDFLKHPGCKIKTLRLECAHKHGNSYFTGLPQGEENARSKTVSMMTLDEAAFNSFVKGTIAAVTPGLGMNGKLCLVSTAGFGTFWDLYLDKEGTDNDNVYAGESFKDEYQLIDRGIETWINPNNGFRVLKIHYTADPDKDPERNGVEWYKKARKRFKGDWEREMEMNPYSSLGKRVYADELTDAHVINDFEIPKNWTRVMALDYGNVVPTAILWAAISPENKVYLYREYYQAGLDIDTHCDNIRILEGYQPRYEEEAKLPWSSLRSLKWVPEVEKIRLRLVDPATDYEARKDVPTIYKVFNNSRNGMGLIKAKNSLATGIERVKQLLKDRDENGAPMIYIFKSLRHFLHEIKNYRFQTQTELIASKKDLSEKPLDKDDHLMDCLRYLVLSNTLRYVDETFYRTEEENQERYRTYVRADGFTTGYC